MLASASDNPEFTAALLDVMGGTLSGLVFIFAAGGIPDWILSERKAIALKLTAGGNSGDPEIFSDYYLKSFGMEGGRSAQGIKDTIKNCCGDQINYLLKPENSGIRGEMMTALAGIILADASLSNRKRFVFRQLAELLKISPFAADKYMNDAAMFIHVTPQRPLPGKGSVASPLSAGQSHGVVCAMSEDEAESAMAESAAGKSQGAVTGGKTISEIRDGEKSGLSPEADAPAAQSEAEPEAGGRKKPAASSKNRRGAAGRSAASEPDAAAGRSASGRRQAAKAAETEAENDSSAAEEPAEKKKKPAKRKSAAKSSSAKSAGEKEASVKADPAKKTRAKRAAGKSAAAAAPEIPEEIPSAEELEYAAERKAEEDVAPSPDVKVRRSRLARAFGRKSNDGSQEAAEESSALENDALMSTLPEPAAEDSGTIGWDSVFPAGADVIPDAGAGAVSGQGKKGKGKGKKAASEEGRERKAKARGRKPHLKKAPSAGTACSPRELTDFLTREPVPPAGRERKARGRMPVLRTAPSAGTASSPAESRTHLSAGEHGAQPADAPVPMPWLSPVSLCAVSFFLLYYRPVLFGSMIGPEERRH